MTKNHKHLVHVKSKNPPVVELDSEAHAAYVRFSNEKVQRTEVVSVDRCLVTMDIDAAGQVIGVELVGVSEFSVNSLVKKAKIRGVSSEMVRNTRYVSANTEPAIC